MKRDREMVHEMVDELRDKEPMNLGLQPASVMQLVGLVQLALRHPGLTASARTFGESFVNLAQQYFANCPTVLEVIRRGDDPQEDR